MTENSLAGCRALIVEDEYLLADELRSQLVDAGMTIMGPVRDVASALALIDAEQPVDVAVLDINLRGQPVFALADLLRRRNIPFVFTTGYDRASIPLRFSQAPHLAKPLKPSQLRATLESILLI